MAYDLTARLRIIDNLSKPFRKVTESVDKADKATNSYNSSQNRLNNTQQQGVNVSRRLASSNELVAKSFRKIVGFAGAFGVGFGFAQLSKALITTGMSFDTAMSQVAAVTGSNTEQMALLREQAKQLGESTVFSASQAAEAMTYLGMAGFTTEEIMASMPGLLDLAAAGALDLASAADIASNIMSGFNKDASEMNHISDVLAKSAASANTNVQQMGNAMSYVAPIASGMGISMEEVAAAVGKLSDAGIQGERAGTSLRGMIGMLAKPTGSTADTLEKFGLSADAVNPKIHSLADIVETLTKAGVTAADTLELVGLEAGPGLAALMTVGADELRAFTGELEAADGAAKTMAEIMNKNLGGSFKEMMSAVEGAALSIYEQLEPSLDRAIKGMTEKVRQFKSWFENNYINNQAFRDLSLSGKITFVVEDIMRVFGEWFNNTGLPAIKEYGGKLGRAMIESLGTLAWNAVQEHPLLAILLGGITAAKVAKFAGSIKMTVDGLRGIGGCCCCNGAGGVGAGGAPSKGGKGGNAPGKKNPALGALNKAVSFAAKYALPATATAYTLSESSKAWENARNDSNSIYSRATTKVEAKALRSREDMLAEMGFAPSGSYAGGLSRVPYDGFVARLHKDERVLTPEENREYSRGQSGFGGVTLNGGITINGYGGSDPEWFADELMRLFVQKIHAAGEAGA